MKLGSLIKQPREREVFTFSMADALEPGERLSSVVLSVSPIAPAGLTIDDYAILNVGVLVWVQDGTAGSEYRVTALITSSAGRIFEDFVIIKVKAY